MQLHRLVIALIASITIVLVEPSALYAAVRWHHETAVYFDVWDKGKAECQATYLRATKDAQMRSTLEERRAALKSAKETRKSCRREAKEQAHAAYLKSRNERLQALKAARTHHPKSKTE